MRRGRRRREGMTLVELIVAMALMSILTVMVVGILSPAAKTFVRLQRVQFAQMIVDNVEDEIRSQLLDAVDSIKIYDISDGGDLSDAGGSASGPVLEYLNTDSYVTLMSADGCAETTLVRSEQETGTESAKSGRLLMRYYWQKKVATETSAYQYNYKNENNKYVARAVQQVFADKYYMGGYLKLRFSFPDGVGVGDAVNCIRVHVELYRDEACTDLLVEEDFIAELRYQAKRVDEATASSGI